MILKLLYRIIYFINIVYQVLSGFIQKLSVGSINKLHHINVHTKLLHNKYYNQQRIDKTKSIFNFNLPSKQILTKKSSIQCYVISDLHADSEKNQQWVQNNCNRNKMNDDIFTVIILPGDIGTEIDRIKQVFDHLIQNYDAVCYVPGNHEAWKRGTALGGSALLISSDPNYIRPHNRMASDSIEKLKEVIQCAIDCGVYVGPLRIQFDHHNSNHHSNNSNNKELDNRGVVVIPLYSWYHGSWDHEPDIIDPQYLAVENVIPFNRRWGDFAMCTWPDSYLSQEEFVHNNNTILAESFAKLNELYLYPPQSNNHINNNNQNITNIIGSPLASDKDIIISFSHFLPFIELCPEKRYLMDPSLTKVIGSEPLAAQIIRLQPHIHLFGHTHIPMDIELDNIRYIQWPLGYYKESKLQCQPIYNNGPLKVLDISMNDILTDINQHIKTKQLLSYDTIWGNYYRNNPRNSSNVHDLAPWVRKRLDSFSGLVESGKKI